MTVFPDNKLRFPGNSPGDFVASASVRMTRQFGNVEKRQSVRRNRLIRHGTKMRQLTKATVKITEKGFRR